MVMSSVQSAQTVVFSVTGTEYSGVSAVGAGPGQSQQPVQIITLWVPAFPCPTGWLLQTRRSTKGGKFILDLEAVQAKTCKRMCKQASTLASYLSLKALEESGVCNFLTNVPSWITFLLLCTPRRYFCCIFKQKGDLQMSYVWNSILLGKVQGSSQGKKDKVWETDFKDKGIN